MDLQLITTILFIAAIVAIIPAGLIYVGLHLFCRFRARSAFKTLAKELSSDEDNSKSSSELFSTEINEERLIVQKQGEGTAKFLLSMAAIPAEYRSTLELMGGRPDSLAMAVSARFPFEFHLRREKLFDRLAKKSGVSKEFQMGWKQFDENVYVEANNFAAMKQILSQEAAALILELFSAGIQNIFATKTDFIVLTRKGYLWSKPGTEDFRAMATKLLELRDALLTQKATGLQEGPIISSAKAAQKSSRRLLKNIVYLAEFVMLAALAWYWIQGPALLLEEDRFWFFTLQLSAAGALLWAAFVFVAYRGSSTAHRQIVLHSFGGLLIVASLVFLAAPGINCFQIESPQTIYRGLITMKSSSYSRYTTRYDVCIDLPELEQIHGQCRRVDSLTYSRLTKGQTALVKASRGRFGFTCLSLSPSQ